MCERQAFVFTSRASWGKEKHDIYLIPHLLIKMEFPCLLNFLPHGVHSKELTIYPFVLSWTSDDFANRATIEHKSLRSHAGTLWQNHTMTWGLLRSGNAQTANSRGKCNPTSAHAQPGTDQGLGALSLGGKFPTVAEGKGGRLKKKNDSKTSENSPCFALLWPVWGSGSNNNIMQEWGRRSCGLVGKWNGRIRACR